MKKVLVKIIPLLYGQLLNLLTLFSSQKAAEKGYNILGTVRKGRVTEKQAPYLEGAKFKKENIAGHQIQSYRWEGEKPLVLLLHGWESNTFRWRMLIKKLKEHQFTIMAFDAPGHGYSSGTFLNPPLYAEMTQYFLDTYRPKYTVGHSMGGLTLQYTNYLKPSTGVEKMVTVGAPDRFREVFNQFRSILKFNDRVEKAMDSYLKKTNNFHIDEFAVSNFVHSNTIQGMIFHDEDDVQVQVEAATAVHQNWPNSQLVLTKGLGHSMHQEEVNERIVAFFES